MTVPVQVPFSSSTASGSTTVFPFSFKIAAAADLSVTLDGVLQTTGYTVSGVGETAGGDVTFLVAPAAGTKVVRFLNPVLNRSVDYQQFGDWNSPVVNLDFDRLWLAMQMLNQNTSRSLKLPVDTAANQEITQSPAARANKGIKFDGDGNLTVSQYDPDAVQESVLYSVAAAESAADRAEAAADAFGDAGVLGILSGGTGASSAIGARENLGLGSASTKDVGTDAGQLIEVDEDGGLPAIDGSKLTGISTFPTGAIVDFPATIAPTGFIKANGALISRSSYSALWEYAQTSGNISANDGAWEAGKFSPGDGSTTFRIPDLRGEFRRGWDDGRGIDSGRTIGSAQAHAYLNHSHTGSTDVAGSHTHSIPGAEGTGLGLTGGNATMSSTQTGSAGSHSHTVTVNASTTGSTETRPRNVALLACIKY